MKLFWSKRALRRLQQLHDHIAAEQPAAAKRIVRSIEETAVMLANFPDAARPIRRQSMFVFTAPGTKYLLVVRTASDTLTVTTIIHGSEDWQRLYPLR